MYMYDLKMQMICDFSKFYIIKKKIFSFLSLTGYIFHLLKRNNVYHMALRPGVK